MSLGNLENLSKSELIAIIENLKTSDALSSGEDVIEKKRMEENLRESEQKFRFLSEQSMLGITILQDGLIKYVNNALAKMIEYTPEEMLEWSVDEWVTIMHPDHRSIAFEQARKKQAGEPDVVIQSSYRLITKTGKIKWVENYSKTIIYEGKTADFITLIDITERIIAEELLRESEKKYRTILESIEDGYYEVDLAGNFTFFNDSVCKLLERSVDELTGMNFRQYMDDESSRRVYEIFNTVYMTKQPIKAIGWKIIKKDGPISFNEGSVSLIIDSSGDPIGFRGIVRDITERKKMEEALREGEEKYRELINNLSAIVTEVNSEGIIDFISHQVTELFGYTVEEVTGKYFFSYIYPEDLENTIKQFNKSFKEEKIVEFEFRAHRKDGSMVDCFISGRIIREKETRKFIAIISDISEKKEIEKERLLLIESERELERRRSDFVSTTSHELRTPLTVIQGHSEFLQSHLDTMDSSAIKNSLNIINKNISRLRRLITSVTDISQIGRDSLTINFDIFEFSSFLDEIVEDYVVILQDQIKYVKDISQLPIMINGDRERLRQVFNNVIENAINHTDKNKRKITISTEIGPNIINIAISDNGAGIEPENLSRIFDQFVSIPTDYSAMGSGIGLFISKYIITEHNGKIAVSSDGLGKGSTFTIELNRILDNNSYH